MRRSQRRVLTTLIGAVALAAGLLAATGGPAGAAVIVVNPGQSIQAAVNSAPSGSVIQVRAGTYRESVEIKKNGLTVQGAGQGQTILLPPSTPPASNPACVEDTSHPTVDGFCIHGTFDSSGNLLSAIQNVRITGFTVQNFSGTGIWYIGATGVHTDHDTSANNGNYGIAAFFSSGEIHQNDTVSGSGEAGLYMGDSTNAHASVSNINTSNNGFGIFVRHAFNGTLQNINATGNCIGVLFLNQGNGESNWVLNTSTLSHNDKACPGSPSGIGVAIGGASHITVNASQVNNNAPGSPSPFSGGVVVASLGPSQVPSNNTISNNSAHGNVPDDIVWDGSGTGNTFSNNSCGTSQPSGLCS